MSNTKMSATEMAEITIGHLTDGIAQARRLGVTAEIAGLQEQLDEQHAIIAADAEPDA